MICFGVDRVTASAEEYIAWVETSFHTEADFIDQLGKPSGTKIDDIIDDLNKLGRYKADETELLSTINSSDYPPTSNCTTLAEVRLYIEYLNSQLATANSNLEQANATIKQLQNGDGNSQHDLTLTIVQWCLIGAGALGLAVIVWYSTYMVMKRK